MILNWTNILLVAFGGAFGASSRYLALEFVVSFSRAISFPLATFLVNVVGCFAAGILNFILIEQMGNLSPNVRLILMTGFLGGFTTFSAFSLDVMRLITAGHFASAASYIILSVIFSILAVFFGFYISSLIAG